MKIPRLEHVLSVGILPFCVWAGFTPEDGGREARFADPPASARILPIHHGRSDDPKKIDAEIDALRLDGFGGMASNVRFAGKDYLDLAKDWDVMRHAVRKARSEGMSLWLYDEHGYPSGTARGKVLEGHPEWQARGALVSVADVAAGARINLKMPPGTFRRAVACPVRDDCPDTDAAVDISASAVSGKVIWDAPLAGPGSWRVYAITEDLIHESTHSAMSLGEKRPYINLLMAEPTARFIELTHARYAKELGGDIKAFTSTFTDEPSLMSNWMRSMPYYVLPWCPGLPDDYRARTGRDLLADVPAIVSLSASGTSPRLRYEFWNMIGDRVSGNYMGQITSWAAKHGILSGGHLMGEEDITAHVSCYGDFFRCLRALSAPSVDSLTSIPQSAPWRTALFGGSAGALNGSRRVMCEASDHVQRYRRPGDTRPVYQVSEEDIIGSLNRLIWGGVNTFTSYYRWKKFTREQINRINTVVGRANTLMSEGCNGAEVAVLYPAESLMSTYRPGLRGGGGPGNVRIAMSFRNCTTSLYQGGRSFMLVDSRALGEAVADGGILKHGDLRWRIVVLPETSTLSLSALRNLYAFWKTGGTVIAAGTRPVNSEKAFPDAESRRLCGEMFGDARDSFGCVCNAAGGYGIFIAGHQTDLLGEIADAVLEPPLSVTAGAGDARLRVARRRTAEGEVLFLLNDSAKPWKGAVRLSGGAKAELWDPRTGKHGPASNAGDVTVVLRPFSAVLLTTASPLVQAKRVLDGGKFETCLMPFAAPAGKIGPPSYARDVQAKQRIKPDGTVWAEARVLKREVDTFLFQPFRYAASPYVEGMRGITFESVVPVGQNHAPELMVFSELEDGSLFLAKTGRSLSERGRERSYVPFTAFSRFGRTGGTAVFDPEKARSFRIGFGGFFGEVGQTIVFETTPPTGYR